MTLDPGAARVLELMAASGRPLYESLSPQEARDAYGAARRASTAEPQPMEMVEDIEAPGPRGPVAMRHYRPLGSGTEPLPLLIYLHGGGWVLGDLDSHDGLCRQFAHQARCAVVSVDYGLAPEAKFPGGVEDAIAASDWLLKQASSLRFDVSRVAIGGDSAGGTLSIATVLHNARAGRSPFSYLMLIYPVTDMSFDTPSHEEFAEGYFLTRSLQEWFHTHYLNDPVDRSDWRASPMRAENLSALPPTFVLTASHDPLRDEAERFAKKLVEAGVTVTMKRAQGQIHGFLPMETFIPAAKAVIAELARHLSYALRSEGKSS
ncbi:acetyl esterase [Rhodoligotrophos appendicifer]|uniref:alpha/beta hydrolase n=1 Tax=Rhodoligotrophos appendicifer TaxID=987056 RepID=UPI00147824B3|nr:alpha/beta hydrolase [Rhodoligotrophos appendicifer]